MAAPLNRTWYDSLVDDVGDGVSGTVWNKAAVDSLLDSVDASLASVVDRTGAPAANQLALFSDGDTLKADARLGYEPTFSQLVITGGAATSGGSRVVFGDLDQPLNQKYMRIDHVDQTLHVRAIGDDGTVIADPIIAGRGGDVTIGRNLTVTGGAVTFPATAIASAGASTLDDYQEFSWVPYFAGSGGNSGTTYAVQSGFGVKIGRFVTLWGVMQVSAPGAIAGNLQLWGFPYFSGNAHNAMGTVTISAFTPTSGTPFSFLSGYIGVNEAVANLTYLPAGGGTAIIGLPASVVMAGTTIYFEARYFAIA